MQKFSNEVRKDILKMIHNAKSGHPGGSLSCVDALCVLYKKILNNANLPVTTILTNELLTVNEDIKNYGLSLTKDEALSIIEKRNESLEDNGRIEFNNVLVKKLISLLIS